jgi:putative membrane protein
MDALLQATFDSLSLLPYFAGYFALGVVLLLAFSRIYTWLTPHDELALVKANNTAAAVALSGALLGFALPLATVIAMSLGLLDCLLWSVVALVVQSLAFVVMRAVLPHLPQRIAAGEVASGVLTAGLSIAVGLINAAAMSY